MTQLKRRNGGVWHELLIDFRVAGIVKKRLPANLSRWHRSRTRRGFCSLGACTESEPKEIQPTCAVYCSINEPVIYILIKKRGFTIWLKIDRPTQNFFFYFNELPCWGSQDIYPFIWRYILSFPSFEGIVMIHSTAGKIECMKLE